MINFEVLGRVTAWQDGWEASLQTQQQLMLARLAIAGGTLVPGSELQHALGWDELDLLPSRGVKQVASELRSRLSPALSNRAPLPGGDGAYRLPLEPEQVDVLRFQAGVAKAKKMKGPDRAKLMREALAEWGPGAAGLCGGHPLSSLPGTWADTTRWGLQQEYRNVVMECIKQDASDGQYETVSQECRRLATEDPKALGVEEFVKEWMRAAYLSGQRTLALEIFSKADEFARRSPVLERSEELSRLAERIRHRDPRPGVPDSLPVSAAVAVPRVVVPDIGNGPTAAPRLVHGLQSSVSTERTAMGESNITFNIGDAARVGSAIGRNEGDVTIHMGAATEPSGDLDDDGEPESADREGRR